MNHKIAAMPYHIPQYFLRGIWTINPFTSQVVLNVWTLYFLTVLLEVHVQPTKMRHEPYTPELFEPFSSCATTGLGPHNHSILLMVKTVHGLNYTMFPKFVGFWYPGIDRILIL